ncbi:hypothetical protein BKA70DRAFT_1280268 [Coprinopsis sp. MPI-PUGE-AT-0042]|nr:hypothetical protein BKA70DRAFT_1280268 [Coprinopsis sp. MPI-PUGE-AT-0042]
MGYWSHNVIQFANSLLLQGPFLILDDILAIIVLACCSVIQVQISYRCWTSLKPKAADDKATRSHSVFRITSIALCFAYLVGASLTVITFILKLNFISRLIKADGLSTPSCPLDYVKVASALCVETKRASVQWTIGIIDTVAATIFQLTVILADSLLVYRCYIVLRSPWSWIISGTASLPLVASVGLLIILLLPNSAAYGNPVLLWRIATYFSLFTNLIVSPVLIIHLRRATQKLESLLGHTDSTRTGSPYKRITEILIEAAFPPIPSGVVHVILFAAFKRQAVVLNMMLLSFAVLAPQTIALRVLQGQQHKPSPATLEEMPTRPIAFGQPTAASHRGTQSDQGFTGSAA